MRSTRSSRSQRPRDRTRRWFGSSCPKPLALSISICENRRSATLACWPPIRGLRSFRSCFDSYTNFSPRKKAKITAQNFQAFLVAGSGGKPDICFETADFVANGVHSATPHNFADFVVGGKTIKFQPDGLWFSRRLLPRCSGRTTNPSAVSKSRLSARFGDPASQV